MNHSKPTHCVNRIAPRYYLPLAGLMLALNACGTHDNPDASEPLPVPAPTKPFDSNALMSQQSVGTLGFYNIGSALGSPVATNTTCGSTNQAPTPSCAYSAAPDHTYFWTAPSSGTFTFTTSGSSYDTLLHIYNSSNGAALGCNDDSGGTLQSSLTLSLSAGQQIRIVVDGYAGNCGGFRLNIASSGGTVKRAMTWSLLGSATDASRAYVLVGSDATTNPYQGDTFTNQALPMLCINKDGTPNPGTGVIGSPTQTPGGAWRRTWSGGTVALTSPILGTSLTSRSTADSVCANQFGAGYRMAGFHDGDPALWSGWDFWAAARGASIAPFQNTRFWVSINDQNANPW
jgi:hypothetical protein